MRVVFVQKFVPHYRLPFFEGVRAALGARGIDFALLYGRPDPYEGSKVRTVRPDWGIELDARIVRVAGRYLYLQGANRHVRRGDFVIVEHAAKLVDNYALFARARLGRIRMGYFGHGENFQSSDELALSRAAKRAMLVNVDRWFAYTDVSLASLLRQGVPSERVTVVNNTLVAPDTGGLTLDKRAGRCVYIGGLYAHKRLGFLLEAAGLVAARRPGFELHVVGDGPERERIEAAARTAPWLVYHGSLYGHDRNALLASAEAILMPGLVGLVVVDAFHFEAPLITSVAGEHSPEIAYVQDGVNSLVDDDSRGVQGYADKVVALLSDAGLAARLRAGCRDAAAEYTIEHMVARFVDGVVATLDPRGKRPWPNEEAARTNAVAPHPERGG